VAENRGLASPGKQRQRAHIGGQEDCLNGPDRRPQGEAIARNVGGIVAVELIAAAQCRLSRAAEDPATLQSLHAMFAPSARASNPDRHWADEMAALQSAVLKGEMGPPFSI
jgi:histidine ammonia-lyase